MKKSRFFPPYATNGSSNLRKFNNRSGVYIIKEENSGELLYIGYSATNIYKTAIRHFQSWEDRTQVRTTFPKNGYSIRIILCTPDRAAILEAALIKKYSPADNPLKLKGKLTTKEINILEDYEIRPVINWSEMPDAPF